MSSYRIARLGWQIAGLALATVLAGSVGLAQEKSDKGKDPSKKELQDARSRDGKKLFSAFDSLRMRNTGGVELSPDNRRIVYTVSEPSLEDNKDWTTTSQVWVMSSNGGDARQMTRGEKSASSPHWSPDGKILAFITSRGKAEDGAQVHFMYTDGGEAWQVTSHKGGVGGFQFSPDSKRLLFTATDQPSKEDEEKTKLKDDTILYEQNLKSTHIWLYDIGKKEETRLTEGTYTVSDPQWSPDGAHISFTSTPAPKTDERRTQVYVLDAGTKEKRQLTTAVPATSGARWSPDGGSIAFIGEGGVGGMYKRDLYVTSASGGTPKKLTGSFQTDAASLHWAHDGRSIYFDSNVREAGEIFVADVAAASIKQITQKGGESSISAISNDGTFAIGDYMDTSHPNELARYDLSSGSYTTLTDTNPWLKEYALASADVVRWKSKDGMEIEGLLYKPVDYDSSKKYPMLVNPHGGPTGSSSTYFNPELQMFAANGYLVLQPNVRGSTGRGEAFEQANGHNGWGKGDYEDVMTGTQAMVDRGIADKDRLGAYGWSYGGYMTMWMVSQTTMFKAISPGAGLSNIFSMYSETDIPHYLSWFFDNKAPWDNYQGYWDASAMKYIKQAKTPTMIMHGQADFRVPIAQAYELYRGLLENNVPVEFVIFPREGHGIGEPRHHLDQYRRYVYFFGKYLNNPPVTEPKQ